MAGGRPGRLRLRRESRLRQTREFAAVRQKGTRLAGGCLLANWVRLPPGSSARVGVVTSGKLGNAVVRSRARRLLREAFRLHRFDLAGPVDLVLVARASIVGRGFAEVEKDFLTLMRKAGLLKRSE